MIKLIYNYFTDINNILTWILSVSFILISILFWKIIDSLIRRIELRDVSIRLNNIKFNGNDIYIKIKSFDGYHYTFELDIDRFVGQGILSSSNFKKSFLLVRKSDVYVFDTFRILFNSFKVKHNFKDKDDYIELSDKTTSSLRRLLINHGLIN